MKRPRGSPTSRLLDRAERERDAARAEVGRLRARAEAAERRALPHSLPEDCPLFYDGCHCLEALEADRPSHAVRADAAEAEVERLTKAVGAAERALEVYRTESVEHWQTRARESRERTTLQLDEARAEVARLRANLEHDGFDCPGCTHGSEHDISDRSCIYGPNSRCATETRAEAAEARAEEADRIRVKAQDRMETAEAEVERLRAELRNLVAVHDAEVERLRAGAMNCDPVMGRGGCGVCPACVDARRRFDIGRLQREQEEVARLRAAPRSTEGTPATGGGKDGG